MAGTRKVAHGIFLTKLISEEVSLELGYNLYSIEWYARSGASLNILA